MTNRKTGLPMPLFLLTLPKNMINKDIFNMTELLLPEDQSGATSTKIGPAQCFRCQGFSTRPNSARGIRNASGVRSAPTSPGTARRRQQRRQPAVIVRVNFWEERARKEGNYKRQRKPEPTQQELQQPLHQPTLPTSESNPSKLYHSPTSEYSPCKHSHSPTSECSSSSQTETDTHSFHKPNLHSSYQLHLQHLQPPSTIAETLKQLREPKVVEIFQVLKQPTKILTWLHCKETFLRPSDDLNLANYSTHRSDRLTHRGGGTAVLVKKSIPHHGIKINTSTVESTTIVIEKVNQTISQSVLCTTPKEALLETSAQISSRFLEIDPSASSWVTSTRSIPLGVQPLTTTQQAILSFVLFELMASYSQPLTDPQEFIPAAGPPPSTLESPVGSTISRPKSTRTCQVTTTLSTLSFRSIL
ncbi:hypothetical protein TNCV_4518701 [Trichonephila clavipes]|nr:hypothetical protein TNCV_4518701 [Trichonephila clavipes]